MKSIAPADISSSPARPLTIKQARALQLAAQGLLQPLGRRPRREDMVAALTRMRLLQIDSIHVVARSPYLVLHARLGGYPLEWLDDALQGGDIAETWAHEACFVPASDIARHRAWRTQRDTHWAHRHAARMRVEHAQEMDTLLERIRASGPVRATDFARADKSASGWWQWKPEKRWLEAWFALGELMVTRRERFQRVYDLAARVLDKLDPHFEREMSGMPENVLRQHFILDSVRALGVVPAAWIADYHRLKPAVTDAELQPLLANGVLHAVRVDGTDKAWYVHAEHSALLRKAYRGGLRATHTALLSPFDPLVWDRTRVRAMFDFCYTIECYVPAPKRQYGYYVLPILHRGQLIGRLDAKAHRAEGVFQIKALYIEQGVVLEQRAVAEVAAAIAATARWHGTARVRLERCVPGHLRAAFRAHWLTTD